MKSFFSAFHSAVNHWRSKVGRKATVKLKENRRESSFSPLRIGKDSLRGKSQRKNTAYTIKVKNFIQQKPH